MGIVMIVVTSLMLDHDLAQYSNWLYVGLLSIAALMGSKLLPLCTCFGKNTWERVFREIFFVWKRCLGTDFKPPLSKFAKYRLSCR